MTRRRYVWNEETQKLDEVGVDYAPEPRSAMVMPEESKTYGDARSPIDGTPIDTRKRHREHMKRHGVAMAQDFASTYEKAGAERQAVREGKPFQTAERREAVGRAIYEVQRRARR